MIKFMPFSCNLTELHAHRFMSFKNCAVSALTPSVTGQVYIIKVSQQAGFTTVC